uniref:Uncharacterized protein n=1 Tax=Anguilla anguilla TaxID=7936 RepID=A0A0E9V2E1_ANGAN
MCEMSPFRKSSYRHP